MCSNVAQQPACAPSGCQVTRLPHAPRWSRGCWRCWRQVRRSPGDVRARCADAGHDGAMSSSRDGIFATALTPAGSSVSAPMAPPRMTKLSCSPWRRPRPPWPRPRGLRNRRERSWPVRRSAMLCVRLPLKGDLGEPVLGDADRPAGFRASGRGGPASQQPSAGVVRNHDDARAFEDLAEFLDHFLFLGSIHSFTPSFGRVSPRLSLAAAGCPPFRVPSGSRAKSPEGRPG
jgi:hypothetical protein